MNITSHTMEDRDLTLAAAAVAPAWTDNDVRDELRRILRSRFFVKSVRLSCFLSTAVEYLLAGKADCFKEYTVGTEVYGRTGDYDPTTDTIVRTEARRLRAKLKDYYSAPFAEGSLRINLVAGSYVPVIVPASNADLNEASPNARVKNSTIKPGPLSLAVVFFHGKGVEQDMKDLAEALEEELTHKLAQNREINLFRMFEEEQPAERRLFHWMQAGVQFALRGAVRQSLNGPVAQLQLTTMEGMIVWSERFICDPLATVTDQIANAVSSAFFSSALILDRCGPYTPMLQN